MLVKKASAADSEAKKFRLYKSDPLHLKVRHESVHLEVAASKSWRMHRLRQRGLCSGGLWQLFEKYAELLRKYMHV